MSIEDTLAKLIAAVNECTAAIKENTATKLLKTDLREVEPLVATNLRVDLPADYKGTTTGRRTAQQGAVQTPEAAQQATRAEQKDPTPLANIPPATYEEVAKLFAAVYANGANKADALAAIAPLPHLKDIKANGEQHPGQLAALKGKLLAAAQKVGVLV
jgi:hypothetical protein